MTLSPRKLASNAAQIATDYGRYHTDMMVAIDRIKGEMDGLGQSFSAAI